MYSWIEATYVNLYKGLVGGLQMAMLMILSMPTMAHQNGANLLQERLVKYLVLTREDFVQLASNIFDGYTIHGRRLGIPTQVGSGQFATILAKLTATFSE